MRIHGLILGLAFATTSLIIGCAAIVLGGGVAATASYAHDRRTAGAIVEDQTIKTKISTAIGKDKSLINDSHINVTSYNAIVLLSGEVPNETLRTRAGEIARSTDKTRRIHNELTLSTPSLMRTRSNDSWITTRVKSSAVSIDIPDFDPSRVKVVTEKGTVFLLGLVHHNEANAVTQNARAVTGVKRIVKLFEYLDKH